MIGISLGITGKRFRSVGGPIPVPKTATLKRLYLPSTIQESAGVVTSWADYYGSTALAPTGSPALDSSGSVLGVAFDGTNDRLDAALVMSGPPCSVFIVKKNASANNGASRWILDLISDGYDSGPAVMQSFTSEIARQPQADGAGFNGNASKAQDGTSMQCFRYDWTHYNRAIWINGAYGAGSSVLSSTTQSITALRVGCNGGNAVYFWQGTIYAICIVEGELSFKEKRDIEDALIELCGLTIPFDAPIFAATVTSGDPEFTLPPYYYAIKDRPFRVYKDALGYRDGYVPRTVSSDMPSAKAHPDEVLYVPTATGTYTLTVTEGDYTQSCPVYVIDLPALSLNVLKVGDSNTARERLGLQEKMYAMFPGIVWLGTKGPSTGYHTKNEGTDSASTGSYTTATNAIFPVQSPFFNGGVVDLDNYESQLADPPDIIVYAGWQNDVYSSMNFAADMATAIANINTMIDWFQAKWPGVPIGIIDGYPLSTNLSLGFDSQSTRAAYFKRQHDGCLAIHEAFDGLEDLGVHVIPTFARGSGIFGYVDSIHWNPIKGHDDLLEAYLAFYAYVSTL